MYGNNIYTIYSNFNNKTLFMCCVPLSKKHFQFQCHINHIWHMQVKTLDSQSGIETDL